MPEPWVRWGCTVKQREWSCLVSTEKEIREGAKTSWRRETLARAGGRSSQPWGAKGDWTYH